MHRDAPLFTLVALSLLAVGGVARAEAPAPPPVPVEAPLSADAAAEAREKARIAYADADTAYHLARFDEAAAKYYEAWLIVKAPSMMFDVAQANRRWFETTRDAVHGRRAVEAYQLYLRDAPDGKLAGVAQKLIGDLQKAMADEAARQRQETIDRAQGHEAIALAAKLILESDPTNAALVLDRVLASHGNPRDVIVEALERRGVLAGQLADQVTAIQSFKKALELDPEFHVSDDADKATREAYRLARGFVANVKPVAVRQTPPGEVIAGSAARITVGVEFDTLELVKEVAVHYRRARAATWQVASVDKTPGNVDVELPAESLSGPAGSEFEYYVVGLDRLGGELAQHGTVDRPFHFTLAVDPATLAAERERQKPAWKKWPLWVGLGVGVIVAGAAAGVIAYFARSDETVLAPSLWDLRSGK